MRGRDCAGAGPFSLKAAAVPHRPVRAGGHLSPLAAGRPDGLARLGLWSVCGDALMNEKQGGLGRDGAATSAGATGGGGLR